MFNQKVGVRSTVQEHQAPVATYVNYVQRRLPCQIHCMQCVPCIGCVLALAWRCRIVVCAHFRVCVGLVVTSSRLKVTFSKDVHAFLGIFSNCKSSASIHDATTSIPDPRDGIPTAVGQFDGVTIFTEHVNPGTHGSERGEMAES